MARTNSEIIFEFSNDVTQTILEEISKAQEYIKIAIFQLHHEQIFNLLTQKIRDGVSVEVFTLPYDSINNDLRDAVTQHFELFQKSGGRLYFCRWNVGDPERTTTAIGRWYSYHGKFIVTEKAAIALSANFTTRPELDAAMIYRNDSHKIAEFNHKFNQLLEWFVLPVDGQHGTLHRLVLSSGFANSNQLFEIPRSITSTSHQGHWIKDYPSALCPHEVKLEENLYICPFDGRGRSLLSKIIHNAKDFLYISTESFTDEAMMDELIRKKINSKIEICILTGAQSMDYTDRLNTMLRTLLASDIVVKTTENNLHAKLFISDELVAVGSINLNKMNLGFGRTSALWRENTETIAICKNKTVVQNAKNQFSTIFDECSSISFTLAKKIETQVKTILKTYFDLNSRQDAKHIFARYILATQIDTKKIALKIGRISKRLAENDGSNIVTKPILLKALILHFLSDRKHTADQIITKFVQFGAFSDVADLLANLVERNYIEQEDDYYKLNIDSLL